MSKYRLKPETFEALEVIEKDGCEYVLIRNEHGTESLVPSGYFLHAYEPIVGENPIITEAKHPFSTDAKLPPYR